MFFKFLFKRKGSHYFWSISPEVNFIKGQRLTSKHLVFIIVSSNVLKNIYPEERTYQEYAKGQKTWQKKNAQLWNSFEEHVGCREGGNLWLLFHI